MLVHKFSGDKTGRMFLESGQLLWVEYIESKPTYTIAPISYFTSADSELVMPTEVVMLGTRTDIRGKLVGVHNLTIAEGATVIAKPDVDVFIKTRYIQCIYKTF